MASVTYDDRSFMIDGQRVWLVSGAIHYFRTPAGLWRDRLLKAKRAGLNCIETYVAWNFHEPTEGKWDFSGDRDVAAFVKLAGELGLYVILRPGPYICAEWDFGGLPAWLTTKTGIAYRTSNAVYTHYYDKYFRQVLPRLADLQVTRGGNIVLIQNENEYTITTMPDRLAYLGFINQAFRRWGFDIPIINCNYATDPPVPDNVECVNGSDDLVPKLKRMRLRQPGAPLLVTEFWDGWFDGWGDEHHTQEAAASARRAMEVLGCAAQCNYYMWHGGTNFAFWGSRLFCSDGSYQTTSYDYDAPLAEGGGLTEKYYLTRLVNVLAQSMGRFFAACTMDGPAVNYHQQPGVLNISGPLGRWAVVTNGGRGELTSANVSLPDGRMLNVSLQPIGAAALPIGLKLSDSHTIDYSNLTPLCLAGPKGQERIIVLHGPAGWAGQVSVNGQAISPNVPSADEPAVIEHQGLLLVLVNSDLARRTWPMDGSLIFGPLFVGAEPHEVVLPAAARQYAVLAEDGKLTRKKPKAAEVLKPPPAPPKLTPWKRLGVCAEPVDSNLTWQPISKPTDVDQLGLHHGYVWYRAQIQSSKAADRRLFLPDCEDRAIAYLNGALLGVWGRGPGGAREPLKAHLKRGLNVLTLLVDNLGRFNAGPRLGEVKGLFGHVHDAKPLPIKASKPMPVTEFPRRIIPRQLSGLAERLERQQAYAANLDFTLTRLAPVHVAFRQVPHHVAIWCNDRFVGFFASGGQNFGDATVGAELKKGRNRIQLMFWREVQPDTIKQFKAFLLAENLTADASWSYRPWHRSSESPAARNLPAWYASRFARVASGEPLFLQVTGEVKGQIFLNGHNVGRLWTAGPQDCYYLPEPWLADDNELILFLESGHAPTGSKLVFRPQGPFRQ